MDREDVLAGIVERDPTAKELRYMIDGFVESGYGDQPAGKLFDTALHTIEGYRVELQVLDADTTRDPELVEIDKRMVLVQINALNWLVAKIDVQDMTVMEAVRLTNAEYFAILYGKDRGLAHELRLIEEMERQDRSDNLELAHLDALTRKYVFESNRLMHMSSLSPDIDAAPKVQMPTKAQR